MTILFVEPSRLFQSVLEGLVVRSGHQALFASTGAEAKMILGSEQVDLICVSLHLGDVSGLDLIHEWNASLNLPLVLLTSEENIAVRVDAEAAGAERVVFKSKLHELQEFLEEMEGTKTQRLGRILWAPCGDSQWDDIPKVLERRGAEVAFCRTREELSAEAVSSSTGLLVLPTDPKRELSECLDELKNIRLKMGQKVPILVLLHSTAAEDRARFLEGGAADVLSLPVHEGEFLARVSRLATMKNLLEQVESQRRQLLRQAMHDQLTGLYNRYTLLDLAQARLSEAKRHKYHVSLLVMDLDHFKKVNDTHGHLAGDRVLAEAAGVLLRAVRKEDVVARYGGEEFVVLMMRANVVHAVEKAESMRKEIEQSRLGGYDVTASFGVATLNTGDRHQFEPLFQRADLALYQAKEEGRNRVCIGE